jgi:hypothetical protein
MQAIAEFRQNANDAFRKSRAEKKAAKEALKLSQLPASVFDRSKKTVQKNPKPVAPPNLQAMTTLQAEALAIIRREMADMRSQSAGKKLWSNREFADFTRRWNDLKAREDALAKR